MTKILTILDGFGLRSLDKNNCNGQANMSNFRNLLTKYPWTTLETGGEAVGQEAGLVGNSEVGHMNIGGLKCIPQISYQITQSSQNGFVLRNDDLQGINQPNQLIDPNKFLVESFGRDNDKTVHLIGLFSTGTIHSDLRHWVGAIESAGRAGASRIILHIISDGRDSDRQSLVTTWTDFIKTYKQRLEPYQHLIFLGSLGGRFYAMDRDNNWERTAMGLIPMLSYKIIEEEDTGENPVLVKYLEQKYSIDIKERKLKLQLEIEKNNKPYLEDPTHRNFYYNGTVHYYFLEKDKRLRKKGKSQLELDINDILDYQQDREAAQGRYDEDILPTNFYYYDALNGKDNPILPEYEIKKNDTLWLLNFRSDRMKQLTSMLVDINSEFGLGLDILTMSDYGVGGEISPIFQPQPVSGTLAQNISEQGLTQLHIAETEKYGHVTYFLNGGNQTKHTGEDWVLIPSNKVTSHKEKPEMKAKEITDYILDNGLGKYDYIIVNYANPDMVGHTGDIEAGIESMNFLDTQLGRLIEAVKTGGHSMIITADHGNIEKVGQYMYHGQNLVDTEHNPSPVPMIIIISDLNAMLEKSKELLGNSLYEVSKKNLQANNQVDLKDQQWLSLEQIPEPELPLWVVGVLLMSL